MKTRTFLATLLSLALGLAAAGARAQTAYPSQPVRIVVGFPAGTASDIIARHYAEKLGEALRQPFIVQNMPGAATNVAAAAVARAAPDGYTLFLASNAQSISVRLYNKLRYEFPGDFAPIALMASAPTVLAVSSVLKVGSVQELVRRAKAAPGELTYGSAGVGTGPQLAAEMFATQAGIKLTHIPYKGTNEAVTDLITGRISMLFAAVPVVSNYMHQGSVNGLAITSAKRSVMAPDMPTLSESGVPGFDVSLWYGLVAPKGTPAPILKALAEKVRLVQQQPGFAERLLSVGAEPKVAVLDDFASFIVGDMPKWTRAVEQAGLKLDQ